MLSTFFFLTKILNILKKGDGFQEFLCLEAQFSVSSNKVSDCSHLMAQPRSGYGTPPVLGGLCSISVVSELLSPLCGHQAGLSHAPLYLAFGLMSSFTSIRARLTNSTSSTTEVLCVFSAFYLFAQEQCVPGRCFLLQMFVGGLRGRC